MAKRKDGGGDAGDPGSPPPGLDAQKHAESQRRAAKAEIIRDGFICSALASGLRGGGQFDLKDFRVYLDGLLADAGVGADPIQRMLVEQVGFAHLRLAQLQCDAALTKSVDGQKVLNAACARLLGEMRRTSLTLAVLKGKGKAPAAPRVKLAQTG